ESRLAQYSHFVTPAFRPSATIIRAPFSRSLSSCQSPSVMKGMKGCNAFSTISKNETACEYVFASMGLPYSGLIISRYHEQKSSHINLYSVISASETLNLLK